VDRQGPGLQVEGRVGAEGEVARIGVVAGAREGAGVDDVVHVGFEGDGLVEEYVGGYADWERMREARAAAVALKPAAPAGDQPGRPLTERSADTSPAGDGTERKRLSYNEKREYDRLPERIEALESEEQALQAKVAAPEFYREGAEAIRTTMSALERVRADLESAYARWDELDSRAR